MTDVEKANPANDVNEVPADFIPMSAPIQRLKVPNKPGFHRHWFRSEPGRIERAMQAGYRFVNLEDVRVNNRSLGGPPEETGSSDLGSRVSISAGEASDSDGKPLRLFLMECPQAYYDRAQELLAEVNQGIADAIGKGSLDADETGETKRDKSLRYVKTPTPDLFRRKN